MSNVRTRMAPSPTGEYHIGHIRTVLYNYAFSRKNKGAFIIRIEDTDRERLVEGAADRILDVINSYQLDWDEGPRKPGDCGPYVQSERLPIYKEYVEKLIANGAAYYCFCSKEKLDGMRIAQQQQGLAKTMYDGTCRNLSAGEVTKKLEDGLPYVVRLKVPKDENIKFFDEVYGEISFNSSDIDDTVLLKSDGFPTYHLAVVIDDHLMNITHVMRGNDWLPSAPKHVLLYKAFGWELPIYVHLPNLKEKGENKKLSKRYGAVFAIDFLKEGYLVPALLNFLMFLGWNPGTEKEIYSLEEFIDDFDIKRIHKTDLVAFDREKLLWINGYYIRNMSLEKLQETLNTWSSTYQIDLHNSKRTESFNLKVLELIQERLRYFAEYVSLTHYFFEDPESEEALILKFAKTAEAKKELIDGFINLFDHIEENNWHGEYLEKASYEFIKEHGYKPKEAFMTLRVIITGETATPPIFDIVSLLGKDTAKRRLLAAQ